MLPNSVSVTQIVQLQLHTGTAVDMPVHWPYTLWENILDT